MRKSKEEAAETRARIIRKASKEFNQHGIAGTGLADVMKSAGLIHGGFEHLRSEDMRCGRAHREDDRSKRLDKMGAEVVIGDLLKHESHLSRRKPCNT